VLKFDPNLPESDLAGFLTSSMQKESDAKSERSDDVSDGVSQGSKEPPVDADSAGQGSWAQDLITSGPHTLMLARARLLA
jgi:hypothetical protein